jgi:hypothetical protein
VRRTGAESLEVVAEGLNFPVAFDFGPDGALYVSLPALGATPGQAMIGRLDLESAATGAAAATLMAAPQCLAAPSA